RRADLSERRSPMPGTQLVLHCGAKEVSREQLATVEAPPPTRTWFPIKHADVLDAVLETVDQTGFAVEKMRLALSRQGSQFFGTLDLRCPIAEGVCLAVGIRNSINRTNAHTNVIRGWRAISRLRQQIGLIGDSITRSSLCCVPFGSTGMSRSESYSS